MRIFKYIKSFRFLIFVIAINVLLCFLLEPAIGASDTMWRAYEKEQDIDTLFVGASVSSATFDPILINDILEVNSFNLGTPLQSIEQTQKSLEKVISEHDIKMVIFGMGFFSLQELEPVNAQLTIENVRARHSGYIGCLTDSIEYICSKGVRETERSINYIFPWLYNHVTVSWDSIVKNVREKIEPTKENFNSASDERREWKLEKGYCPYTGCDDYSKRWFINSHYIYSQVFQEELVKELKDFILFCNENEIDLIIVNTPKPVYDVISYYDVYFENDAFLEKLSMEYDVEYYDFSLVKSEVFDVKKEYFYDFEHLNYLGSQEFSKAFGEVMKIRNEGGDISEFFYTVEEYLEKHSELLEEWKQVQM